MRRKTAKKNSGLFRFFFYIVLFLIVTAVIFKYKNAILYYLGIKSSKYQTELSESDLRKAKIRIHKILEKHDENAIGFDVSEYQSSINWKKTYHINESYELSFVFVRATAGSNKVDKKFAQNWYAAKKRQLIRGAYHYYRPNENSLEQATNFIKTVQLKKGDLPPVLDIEKIPRNQSMANLKKGLKRWLEKIEQHYQMKPIIYSGESYYSDFLKDEFSDYHLWIANYNFYRNELENDWKFWQFTERAKIEGVPGYVDLNIYNGNKLELTALCK